MEDVLTVRRWRRYGADRLYVTHENGQPVGSVDLQSGEVVASDPLLEAEVRRAAQAYLRSDLPELVVPAQRLAPPDEAELRDLQVALEAWLGTKGDEPGPARASSIGERLDRLADEGWATVHDVPLGRQGTCVEHLLIGPGGLFTVTERRHPGAAIVGRGRAMSVDGRPVAYLRDARLEATRTQDRLLAAGCAQIHVRAVLVLQGKLTHDGNPMMTWMVSNVVCHRDAKDNIYPRKERHENKIDGPVAGIMAIGRVLAGDQESRPPEVILL
ncbi:MAG: NERD domain-containing protein [Cellulomonas sp.]|nr:NERD domain-containing protein [Cellulomonas sp.]